jgi:hypothetical protein
MLLFVSDKKKKKKKKLSSILELQLINRSSGYIRPKMTGFSSRPQKV